MKILMTITGLVLLASNAAAQVTQSDFDNALSCCWTGSPYAACTTQAACASGAAACEAPVFYYLEPAFNKRWHSGLSTNVASFSCGGMSARGEESDANRLFAPPGPLPTGDGETLKVSEPVASSLRTATQVMKLQSRGASKEEIVSAVGNDADISIDAAGNGMRVITIRGDGADDIVLRFDGEGKLQHGGEKE